MSDFDLTDEEIDRISAWSHLDFRGLMAYVKAIWWASDWGWHQEGEVYSISTGGWSGNETIISALRENHLFWSLCWQSSRRGGHYVFDLSSALKAEG